MTALANLKLIAAKRPTQLSPVALRRNKVAIRIDEQIELAKAQSEGREFVPTRMRSVRDDETGETKSVQVPKRVKAWWWAADNGKLCLSLRYGAKVIELAKGKSAVEVAGDAELVAVLETLKAAIAAGELDTQIEAVARSVTAGFKK